MLFRILHRARPGLRYTSGEPVIKGTGKNGEVTQMDILKWRQQQQQKVVREVNIGGQTVKWNYRSEIVKRHGLDNNHRYTWVGIGICIIIGFTSFIAVKTNVIENRRQAMIEREEIRKSLQLVGEDRKKVAIV